MTVQTTELVGDTSLATEKVGKLLLKYSIPAIIGMVVNMLYNVVDRIYIGNIPHVGELAITGVGITSPITTMITGLGLLIGAGCSANISLNLGSRDKEKAQRTLNVGFVLTLIMSVIIAVFGNLFAVQLTGVFGATENTMPFALQYLRPLMFGAIFNLIVFNLNTSISADCIL